MNDRKRNSLSGLLVLDKPAGVTSRSVVDRVARPLRGSKVGHAGTLDPLATGVLVVCVGPATRLIEYVQRMSKTYRTVIRLGARSDTNDADGVIVPVESPRVPDESEVRTALAGHLGTIAQQPPEYSALKVGGRRAYDLARAGRAFALAPRPVTIERIDLLDLTWPRLELEITCGAGTYIRSIARDLGETLGCGGLVEVLVRTRIGPFTQAEALDPLALTAETIPGLLRPARDAVSDLPRVRLSADQVAAIGQGRALRCQELSGDSLPPGEVALLDSNNALVAIAESDPATGRVSPRRVLATA